MRRREFITILGGAAAAWPLAAPAQTGTVHRIGILHPGSPPDPWLDGLRHGLQELGYVEGRNIITDYRWAEGRADRLNDLARELIASKVDVLIIMTGPAVLAAKRHSSTVPIVMAVSGDPVGVGAVASIARPGGRVVNLKTARALGLNIPPTLLVRADEVIE